MLNGLRKIGICILSLTLIAVSVIPFLVNAQGPSVATMDSLNQATGQPQTKQVGSWGIGADIIGFIFNLQGTGASIILHFVMQIVAGLLGLAGMILDGVLKLTVVEMASRIQSMTAINDVWKVIRDLGNMSFIFILLYHGIRMVLGLGSAHVKKVIGGIVIAAILVNFSLFFTKALIDASNIVTLGFYNSISNSSGQLAAPTGSQSVSSSTFDFTFSGAFMKSLGVSGLFSTEGFALLSTGVGSFQGGKLAVFYICAIFFMLLCAFVFLAVSVLFVARFMGIVILLMMSPIAFLSLGIPGLESAKQKYWGTLSSQLLFGPLYMLYSWVILILMGPGGLISGSEKSLGEAILKPEVSTITVIINFIILIGLLITSLVEAKKQATSGGIITNKWLDKGQEYMGGAIFGSAGALGRNTFGRAGQYIAESETLKDRAAAGSKLARFGLLAGNKLGASSYDARNTKTMEKVTGDIMGIGKVGSFGKGGGVKGYKGAVDAALKAQAEKDKARAEQFKLSDRTKAKNKALLDGEGKEGEAFIEEEATKKKDYLEALSTQIKSKQDAIGLTDLTEAVKSLTKVKTESNSRKEVLLKSIESLQEQIGVTTDINARDILTKKVESQKEEVRRLIPTINETDFKIEKSLEKIKKIEASPEYKETKDKIEQKEKDKDSWISLEKENLIGLSGGRKAEGGKPAIDSADVGRINTYADRVATKTGLWSGFPNILIDREYSKQRARAVKKLAKPDKTPAQLLKELNRAQKKANDAAGIKEEEEEEDNNKKTPPPDATPPTTPPTTNTTS